MRTLESVLDAIRPVDRTIEPAIQAHQDDLTKPQGSLGRLESVAMQYCLIQQTTTPRLGKKLICCFAGDHGVAAEGVSAFPPEVTPQMVMNMLAGGAGINVLCRNAGAELKVIDVGVNDPLENAPGLCRRKVSSGTANMTGGPAMTLEETTQALLHGIEFAEEAARDGVTLLGTGEMGIANTTPATALFSAYLGIPVEEIAGRGSGIEESRVAHEAAVIAKALDVNAEHLKTPLGTLAAVGGLEIAGICGLILGAAKEGVPVVVDGFISTAAAVAACALKPEARDYMIFSHMSSEQGHRKVMEALKAETLLDLELRLGEGTGAALAMLLIEASIKTFNEMATFSSAGVSEEPV